MSLSLVRARRRGAAIVGVTALAAATFVVAVPGTAVAEPVFFSYTGEAQSYVVPADVCQVQVDALGASAGLGQLGWTTVYPTAVVEDHDVSAQAGEELGGHTTATVPVTPGETLTVLVGGEGGAGTVEVSGVPLTASATSGSPGFNGGASGSGGSGSGTQSGIFVSIAIGTGGGGGASDVRRGSELTGRLVVAGGGGSAGAGIRNAQNSFPAAPATFFAAAGGAGGGSVGTAGGVGALGGGGGTQTTGGPGGDGTFDGVAGSSGAGGSGTSTTLIGTIPNGIEGYMSTGGAGGGGYFGGGGGGAVSATDFVATPAAGGGGGGSGYGPVGASFETGVNDGDGEVTITPAAPGLGCAPRLQVAKTVTGPRGTGAVVRVDCESIDPTSTAVDVEGAELAFLPDGTPDPTDAPEGWEVVEGVWQVSDPDLSFDACTATEIDDGGADTVSYACAWTVGANEGPSFAGCPGAEDGPSASPRSVTLIGDGDIGRLTVTNAFPTPPQPPAGPTPAAALVASPRFTG